MMAITSVGPVVRVMDREPHHHLPESQRRQAPDAPPPEEESYYVTLSPAALALCEAARDKK